MMPRGAAENVARTWEAILQRRHPEYGRITVSVVDPNPAGARGPDLRSETGYRRAVEAEHVEAIANSTEPKAPA